MNVTSTAGIPAAEPRTSDFHSALTSSNTLCLSFPGTISRNSGPALEQSPITARSHLTGNEIGGPRVLRAEIPGRGKVGRNGDGEFSHHTLSLQPNYKPKAHQTDVPIFATVSYRFGRPSRNRRPSRADTGISSIPISTLFARPTPTRASSFYSRCYLAHLFLDARKNKHLPCQYH